MDWKTLDRLICELEGMIDSKLGREFPPSGFLFSGPSWKDIWEKAAEFKLVLKECGIRPKPNRTKHGNALIRC